MADCQDYLALVMELQKQARHSDHRMTLLLSGEAEWARQLALWICHELVDEPLWLGRTDEWPDALSANKAGSSLGSECSLLVYDAHAGFNPDAFGAVTGTLCGGGLLILLTPTLSCWPEFADPEYQRLLVANYHSDQIKGRFIYRLREVLNQAEGCFICEQDQPLPSLPKNISMSPRVEHPLPYLSHDQQSAVEAIHHVVSGHRRRPLVLTSDRGRGKSAALGLAAAQLLKQGVDSILLTAPRRDAVQSVFAQAQQLLPDAKLRGNSLCWQQRELKFIPPDQLLEQQPVAELLLVDEAAAIPVSILQRLLEAYSRIVFASTIHGYEGCGGGFAIRFQQYLESHTAGVHRLHLQQPIRWAEDDPLESLVFNALCLDAEPASLTELTTPCHIRCIERDLLLQQPALLRQLFGLLVSAHYRTSPSDLQNLLDGPNLFIYLMQDQSDQIVGALLMAEEGGLSPELALQIQRGERRPRGHLMAQSLTAQLGVLEGVQLRCGRVMRIAIHPQRQRCGLGGQLLDFVREDCRKRGLGLLGASFGATEELLNFWLQQGLLPVLLGVGKEASSGAHSVLMMEPLDQAGEMLFQQARQQGGPLFLALLGEPLQELELAIALQLLQHLPATERPKLSDQDRQNLYNFAYHQRGYELTLYLLKPLAEWALLKGSMELTLSQKRLLLSKVLQRNDWQRCVQRCGLAGRKSVIAELRVIAQQFSQQC